MAYLATWDTHRIGRAMALASICIVPAIGIGITGAAPPENSQAGGKVHVVEARVKPIIRIGQLEFRDLKAQTDSSTCTKTGASRSDSGWPIFCRA
jgi:hypothetical protein